MLRHYFIAAFRFLSRNKIYTGINILGLSLSFAVSFIILLFVINEFSFDHCHKQRNRIFRVLNYYVEFNATQSGTPYVLADALKEEFPQVEKAVRSRYLRGFSLKLGEEYIPVPNAVATDSEVFDIFTIHTTGSLLGQDPLDDLNSIVLSREQAGKFFPGEDPVGKEIEALINNTEQVLIVSGVFEDIPRNSTFRAECFLNSKWTLEPINQTFGITNADVSWLHDFWITWVLLSKDCDVASLEGQFRAFEIKYISEEPHVRYSLQKLTDVYLRSDEVSNTGLQGNMKNIRLFSTIAFLILLIAAFNYVILSNAVSTERTREIGIRKTAGASIRLIRNQMLSESIMLALFVLPFALLMMLLAIPSAEKLFQTSLEIIPSNLLVYIPVYLVLTLMIGLASGIYTSSYLSRLKVLDVLKGSVHFVGKRKQFFRSLMIVIQLAIFCSFVSGTLIMHAQYRYAINKDPGHFVKDVLLIDLGRDFQGYTVFLNAIKSNPDVIMAAGAMDELPMMGSMASMQPHFQDKEVLVKVEGMAIDYHFLETMGITILEGRDFSEDYGSELTHSVIVNETAVKSLGIDDPLGKILGGKTIIGIAKDFNLHSIHSEISPLDISLTDRYIHQLAVHYNPGALDRVLTMLKSEWEIIAPDLPFQYSTIEELIESAYSPEKNLTTTMSVSALFAMLIAAFGLFGLTLFISKSREHEIGIRKVLGSSEGSIVRDFLMKYFILVMAAFLLSVPVTLYSMSNWLNNFAFRVDISWWPFAIAFIVAAVVVLSTVFVHSFRASRINPVEILRYE